MTLDELRAAAPTVGFVVYAWAGEPVTLELHFATGAYHALRAWTTADVVAQAADLLGLRPAPEEPEPEEPQDIFD